MTGPDAAAIPAARRGDGAVPTARGDGAIPAVQLEFEVAVAVHYVPLVRRLALILGDPSDAEDVAQEAFLAAFRAWSSFDGADVRAWLYTIALRRAFDHLRRRRRWLARLSPGPGRARTTTAWTRTCGPRSPPSTLGCGRRCSRR